MLSILIFLPIIGAAIVGFLPGKIEQKRLFQITSIFAYVIFAWTLFVLTQFDPNNSSIQLQEYLNWIETIGLSYSLGVDGLSLPLLALGNLLLSTGQKL
jgi:NAD(P)H-quinone oxidoreductase subunit 4